MCSPLPPLGSTSVCCTWNFLFLDIFLRDMRLLNLKMELINCGKHFMKTHQIKTLMRYLCGAA